MRQELVIRPGFRSRCAANVEDFRNLLQLRLALEDRVTNVQLGKHTANAPHVNTRIIARGTKEQLGWAVPQRDHLVREKLVTTQGARQSKVCNFEQVISRHQQIGALDVSVHAPMSGQRSSSSIV